MTVRELILMAKTRQLEELQNKLPNAISEEKRAHYKDEIAQIRKEIRDGNICSRALRKLRGIGADEVTNYCYGEYNLRIINTSPKVFLCLFGKAQIIGNLSFKHKNHQPWQRPFRCRGSGLPRC